jgi:hypothetical protein
MTGVASDAALRAGAYLGSLPSPSVLADASDDEKYKSGPWGFAIILLLGIACYFLFRSMSRHLRKVRDEFPVEASPNGKTHQGEGLNEVDDLNEVEGRD